MNIKSKFIIKCDDGISFLIFLFELFMLLEQIVWTNLL